LWKWVLQKSLNELNIKNPIVWLSRPEMVDLIGGFNEKIVIYHIVDEYLAYSDVDKDKRTSLEKYEHRMLKNADLVIVVSENLYLNKKKYNKNTYKIKNATDFEAYSQVIINDHPCSNDIKNLTRPIIGYSGLISERLDLDLIQHLAQTHPEWSITLVGQVNDRNCANKINSLKEFKNIYFLGRKKITQLPNYVKAFDVGIIPYEIDEQSKNVSPLKLYDYLAAGIPIVISDLPAAHEFKEVIYIADNKEKFNVCVEHALASDNRELFLKRRNLASKNTWDERVKQISNLITQHLKSKNYSNECGRILNDE
jgi:glycosyltransferase involved in cell wall biosynthesis